MPGTSPGSQALSILNEIFHSAQIVDLTALLEKGIPRWPSHAPLMIDATNTHEHDGYACQTLSIAEHVGTHVDAPYHVHADLPDLTIEHVPLNAFIGKCTVVDLTFKVWEGGERAELSDVRHALDQAQTEIEEGDIVLFHFGWMKYWTTSRDWGYYANNQPGFTEEVADYLLNKRVKAVGTDTAAVGTPVKNGVSDRCFFHERVLRQEVYLIECLNHLDRLPSKCFFMAQPLKIRGGSGSPVRALAVIPSSITSTT
jgi:arylformamidase